TLTGCRDRVTLDVPVTDPAASRTESWGSSRTGRLDSAPKRTLFRAFGENGYVIGNPFLTRSCEDNFHTHLHLPRFFIPVGVDAPDPQVRRHPGARRRGHGHRSMELLVLEDRPRQEPKNLHRAGTSALERGHPGHHIQAIRSSRPAHCHFHLLLVLELGHLGGHASPPLPDRVVSGSLEASYVCGQSFG